MELKDVTLDQLGTIKKVIVTKDHTTMIAGNNPSDNLKQRIESIENQLAKTTSSYDQKQLKERLGKLSNGVATIKVGATTESELKEKKLRIEDALNATKAAVEEGIVIGGGAALVEAYKEVKPQLKSDNVDVQKVFILSWKPYLLQFNKLLKMLDIMQKTLLKAKNCAKELWF